jgi:hypothetical protein
MTNLLWGFFMGDIIKSWNISTDAAKIAVRFPSAVLQYVQHPRKLPRSSGILIVTN